MKNSPIPLIFSILLIAIFNACSNGYATDISVAEFTSTLTDTNVQLLDVRTPEEYNQQHLPNALLLDWNDPESFSQKISKIDPTKKTLLYCKSGMRSGEAATYLLKKGFTDIHTLKGGIMAYNKEAK